MDIANSKTFKSLPVIFIIFLVEIISAAENEIVFKNKPNLLETIRANNTELGNWDPPFHMKKMFPYYLAGYDYEDRPVWLLEFGKYDIRSYFEKEGQVVAARELFEKYTDQFLYLALNSPAQRPKNPHHPTDEVALVCDLDSYDLKQLSSIHAVRQTLKLARDLNIVGDKIAYLLILNTNFFGQSIINIVRPALGGVFEKLEVYGTNKESWLPKVLKKIPKESLGEWYGGFKNYTPIAIYG